MIKLQDITYKIDEKIVLDTITFSVKKGEKVVLLGINGVGKSTLLKIIDGLIFPSEGEYYFNNYKITEDKLKDKTFNKYFRKNVVMLFQNPDIMLFNPTVYDEIAFGLKQFDFDSIDERVKYWSSIFKIDKYLKKSPFELSGGEKQKVCLASILAIEPHVLLLDEPTSNLDPKTTGWFIEFLTELNLTMIITSHNLSLAQEIANRTIVLGENHKILYDGKIEELLKNEDLLFQANLVRKPKRGNTFCSHYHLHEWD
jgi:cobalt/nickel transport system ATP-binding protein